MSKLGRIGLIVALLGIPALTNAQTAYNKQVLRVFAESQSGGGFYPTDDISAECLGGIYYLDLSIAAGRGQLALLIAAKAQGLLVQRIDYAKNYAGYPASACVVRGLHVQ